MIESSYISANGIRHHLLVTGSGDETILFVHGNGSDSVFWKSLMRSLPKKYKALAPDLRGFGKTEAVPCDATKSFGSFVSDLMGLLDELNIEKYHFVGHSLGGGIGWELLIKDHKRIKSLILINPASPFGFGGTKDEKGTLTFEDGAGSGAGVINPDFVKLLKEKDKSGDHPSSPRNVMNSFYWAPPFVPEEIDELVDGLLRMQIGDQFYPGDSVPSDNFPFSAPGKRGQINAAAPNSKIGILDKLTGLENKPPILWIRGAKDQIVSDNSMFDTAVHGSLGVIPKWPGAEICPPQPMISQTRYALEAYKNKGGDYREEVMENSGHSPYIEDLQAFNKIFILWLEAHE